MKEAVIECGLTIAALGVVATVGALVDHVRIERASLRMLGLHDPQPKLYDWQAENRRRQWGVRRWGPL